MATKSNKLTLSYNEECNTLDIRTVQTTKDNKSFIVDAKLIDILIGQLIPTDFPTIQESLCGVVEESESMEEMMQKVEEFFYIHKVTQKLKEQTTIVNEYALAE